MSRWRRFWNALCSIKRIFRCCKRETFLPLTNCGGVNTDHRPRTIVTWNVSFERRMLQHLASAVPKYSL